MTRPPRYGLYELIRCFSTGQNTCPYLPIVCHQVFHTAEILGYRAHGCGAGLL